VPTTKSKASRRQFRIIISAFMSKAAAFLSIKRMIARVDIHFSNSMVESLFRMLKTNFLKSETLRSLQDVERKIDFFFTEHNEVIPRYQFQGATPKEKFLNTWTKSDLQKMTDGLAAAVDKRIQEHKEVSCGACRFIS